MKCMMFGNSNTGIEKELAMEDYKVHTVRNRGGVLAVILTAVLLAVVFNVGLSLVRTVSLATAASPGPGADGNCVYGDYEILEKVRALPQVEWAAFVRRCSSTYLHNKEFAGVETRLFAADSVHYDKKRGGCNPSSRYDVGAIGAWGKGRNCLSDCDSGQGKR